MIPNIALGEGLTLSYLDGINCLAIGGKTKTVNERAQILAVRQRTSDPSVLEIDFSVVGNGEYEFVVDYCAFSINSTNGIDGDWYVLTPDTLDSKHIGSPFSVAGTRTGTFVVDMDDHMTGFSSETEIYFRITVEWTGDL